MKKLKWHGIAFSLLILFIYIMGTYDFFMMLSHNEAYYVSKGYGETYIAAYASFLLDLFLILFGAIWKNRFGVFDLPVICFDIFILIITFLFGAYLHAQVKTGRGMKKQSHP